MVRTILAALCLVTLAAPSGATRKHENYPKLLVYSSAIGQFPAATQDSLAWYDVLVCYDRPEVITSLRGRNPGLRCLWSIQPQFATPPGGENPWWLPDTLWSASRLIQYYAQKNDWYLRDTAGRIITDGSSYVLNWTRYCPVGTFGSAKGLRAAEWIASRALPQIALSHRYWDTWSWESDTAYNGFMFEILADCLGSYGWRIYASADPDRDGVAEGVYSACSTNGANDPLSVLMREENDVFYALLDAAFPPDFAFLINENNQYIGPSWRTHLSGMKLENWMRPSNPTWHDWWDWFYGLTPPWAPEENWGAGYAWTEAAYDAPVADSMKGWDLSFIQVWAEPARSTQENLQQMRWGLGTTMLGDGYFTYTKDQKHPLWQREFDWDFGLPLGPFTRETDSSADTLYVRLFDRGMVEVNPYNQAVSGVPARDSRFTFWLPVTDLSAQPLDGTSLRAEWTIPDGVENEADSFELRYAAVPITLANWGQATPYPGGPIAAAPGTTVSAVLAGLQEGTRYHLAVRTRTRGRVEPLLSNPCVVETPVVVDRTAPASIQDLTPRLSGQTWIQLTWTATGDDGALGTAASYQLRYVPDGTIETEPEWAAALRAGGLPAPHASGTSEQYFLSGLSANRTYGVAVRAVDETGALSPLHPPVHGQTLPTPPPDGIAPSGITDLTAAADGVGAILLEWTAPGDDGLTGRPAAYSVRMRADHAIESAADWQAASVPPAAPPTPQSSGSRESMRLASLTPGRAYGIAVRALDEAANMGELSNRAIATAGEDTPPPPPPPLTEDETPPSAIEDLTPASVGDSFVVLLWTAPGDDGLEGTAAAYELRIMPGAAITGATSWRDAAPFDPSILPAPGPAGSEQSCRIDGLLPGRSYGAAVRARDEAENLGALVGGFLFATTETPQSPPPPPLPVQPPFAVSDLHQAGADTLSVLLSWTAPAAGAGGRAARYLLRAAPSGTPDTLIWTSGEEVSSLPSPASPGAVDSMRVTGLAPSGAYGFILRSEDDAGLISPPSNALWATTSDRQHPPPPPVIPLDPKAPAPITDLSLATVGSDSALVVWTAPGDDGSLGRAERYEARITAGSAIASEEEWLAALTPDTTGIGRPLTAGSPQRWALRGLAPETTYALALRAVDDSGLVAPLSNPLQWTTLPIPPAEGPGAVLDLVSLSQGPDWIELSWSAPAPGTDGSSPARYRLAMRPGAREILTDEEWVAWEEQLASLPSPTQTGAPQACHIDGLDPSRCYALSLRAEDPDGHLAPIGSSLVAMTRPASSPGQPPEVADLRPAPIADLAATEVGASWVDLAWTAVGDDSLSGIAERYLMRIRQAAPLDRDSLWALAEGVDLLLPAPMAAGTPQAVRLTGLLPASQVAIAIRAVDPEGWVSPFAPGIRLTVVPYVPVSPSLPDNVRLVEIGTTRAILDWVQPASAEEPNGVASYAAAIAKHPLDESNWREAAKLPNPPLPAATGGTVAFTLEALDAGTDYWVAIRTRSPEGHVSSGSATAHFTTLPLDLAPPEPPTGLGIIGAEEQGRILLRWVPSPSPYVAAYVLYGASEGDDWSRIETEPLAATATEVRVSADASAFALSSVDRFGNEGALSEPVRLAAPGFLLRGPYPHPVTSSCRIEIELPEELRRSQVSLKIYDERGIEVRDLSAGGAGAGGRIEMSWDRKDARGRTAAAGFYLLVLEAGGRQIRRTIFLDP